MIDIFHSTKKDVKLSHVVADKSCGRQMYGVDVF